MNKFILVALALLFSVSVSYAQAPTPICTPFTNSAGQTGCVPLGSKVGGLFSFNIAASGTTSNTIDTQNSGIFGWVFPSGWTAANVTFKSGLPGSDGTCATANMVSLINDSGTAIGLTVSGATAPFYVAVANPVSWLTVRCLQIVSSVSQTNSVNVIPIFNN